MKPKKERRELFGTRHVAEMLGIPEWRVKNFSEGEGYRLSPTVVGQGRGSRRLYDWKDVCRIAIANELVRCGFTAEAVGSAIREIPESKLVARDYYGSDVLVGYQGEWSVMNQKELKKLVRRNSVIVIPFQQIIWDLKSDIEYRLAKELGVVGSEEA